MIARHSERGCVMVVARFVPFRPHRGGFGTTGEGPGPAIRSALTRGPFDGTLRVDDQSGELDSLLVGSQPSRIDQPDDIQDNDAVLRGARRADLPALHRQSMLSSLDGTTSASRSAGRRGRTYMAIAILSRGLGGRQGFAWAIRCRPAHRQLVTRSHGVGLKTWTDGWLACSARRPSSREFSECDQREPSSGRQYVQISMEKEDRHPAQRHGSAWVGRELSESEVTTLHAASKEASEASALADHASASITGSAGHDGSPVDGRVGLPTE